MKISKWKTSNARFIGGVLFVAFSFFSIKAQSTSQNYPTPVATNEISGKIAARDLGDARLTSYYYVFSGSQGDVFLNVKTSNLDGDIDVFTAENLRPLTKITVFSDIGANENGRVIYLRKPEKLILRIEGRTPNEQSATFNLKFAGSFVPAPASAANDSPEPPELKTENESGARVNSVGTIIEVKPTPKPSEVEIQAEPEKDKQAVEAAKTETTETIAKKSPVKSRKREPKKPSPKITKSVTAAAEEVSEKSGEVKPVVKKTPAIKNRGKAKTASSASNTEEKTKVKEPNPLESITLFIEFKDGTKIARPMSEVLRVGVDKGVLTLITKGGAISRYSILDVARMTIE